MDLNENVSIGKEKTQQTFMMAKSSYESEAFVAHRERFERDFSSFYFMQ